MIFVVVLVILIDTALAMLLKDFVKRFCLFFFSVLVASADFDENYVIHKKYASNVAGYFSTPHQLKAKAYWDQFKIIDRDYPATISVASQVGFAPSTETADVFVPETYDPEKPIGLYIHISPGNNAYMPERYHGTMTELYCIGASPENTGNDRHDPWRIARVLDLMVSLKEDYNIDENRVFVGGFSGGALISILTGMLYPDEFPGIVPTEHAMDDSYWQKAFLWSDIDAMAANNQKWAFIVGTEHAPWFFNTNINKWQNYRFKTRHRVVPGMGHIQPPANELKTALIWVDPITKVDPEQTSYQYDFGIPASPVPVDSWVQVTPKTHGDIEWSASVLAADRGITDGISLVDQDLIYSATSSVWSHQLSDGIWTVTVRTGDYSEDRDFIRISAEDGQVVREPATTVAGSFVETIFDVVVLDGVLDLEFSDTGGNANGWAVTGVTLEKVTDQIVDSDGDALGDAWEYEYFKNLTSTSGGELEDADNDGLIDREEFRAMSDPTTADTDGDTLSDFEEVTIYHSSPINTDSDEDGYFDDEEVVQFSNPNAYNHRPQVDGLVAYYRFDEGSGDEAIDGATDDTLHNGFQQGGLISWSETGQQIGAFCLNLDGNAYLRTNSAIPDDATAFTISAWVNPELDGGYKGIYSGRGVDGSTGLGNWGINVENGHGDLRFANTNGSSLGVDTAANSVVASGGWYHLAMTWSGNGSSATGKVYHNGQLVETRSSGLSPSYIQPARGFFIGNDPALGGRVFAGKVDDLAVFTRALSAQEISAIHVSGQQGQGVLKAIVPSITPDLDRDGDSITDADEAALYGTNMFLSDTDGDGVDDGVELLQRSDPTQGDSRPLVNGLVAYYPFDEGTGDTAFDKGTDSIAHDALQQDGTVTWSRTEQQIGHSCLDLDGASSLQAFSPLLPDTSVLTISVWVNPGWNFNNGGIYVGRESPEDADSPGWGISYQRLTGDIYFPNREGGTFVTNSVSSLLASNGWYHLAMSWETTGEASTAKVYRNGVLVRTNTTDTSLQFVSPVDGFLIGGDSGWSDQFFLGQIDDLAVFNRLLTDAEVEMIYNRGLEGQGIYSAILPPPLVEPGEVGLQQVKNSNSGLFDFELSWRAQEHAYYDILMSTDLLEWQPVQINVLGDQMRFVPLADDENAEHHERVFYRVQQK